MKSYFARSSYALSIFPDDHFLYRCPTAGHDVQGFVPDNAVALDDSVYEAVTCTVCRGVHLVNAKTGRAIGGDSKLR